MYQKKRQGIEYHVKLAVDFCLHCWRHLLVGVLCAGIVVNVLEVGRLISPAPVPREFDKAAFCLRALGCPESKVEELTLAVKASQQVTGFSEALIVAIMWTESEFHKSALGPPVGKSGFRYKGLMGTPWASFEYASVDTMLGAEKLQDKMVAARGDIFWALSFYKGGRSEEAQKNAREVLRIYEWLLDQLRLKELKESERKEGVVCGQGEHSASHAGEGGEDRFLGFDLPAAGSSPGDANFWMAI